MSDDPANRPLIYIAGPYTFPDPVENTRTACRAGDAVWAAGGCPVVPHLSMLWHVFSPADYQTWLDRDLGLLARCDAVLRLPGESAGADLECAYAREHETPVIDAEASVPSAAIRVVDLAKGRQW